MFIYITKEGLQTNGGNHGFYRTKTNEKINKNENEEKRGEKRLKKGYKQWKWASKKVNEKKILNHGRKSTPAIFKLHEKTLLSLRNRETA